MGRKDKLGYRSRCSFTKRKLTIKCHWHDRSVNWGHSNVNHGDINRTSDKCTLNPYLCFPRTPWWSPYHHLGYEQDGTLTVYVLVVFMELRHLSIAFYIGSIKHLLWKCNKFYSQFTPCFKFQLLFYDFCIFFFLIYSIQVLYYKSRVREMRCRQENCQKLLFQDHWWLYAPTESERTGLCHRLSTCAFNMTLREWGFMVDFVCFLIYYTSICCCHFYFIFCNRTFPTWGFSGRLDSRVEHRRQGCPHWGQQWHMEIDLSLRCKFPESFPAQRISWERAQVFCFLFFSLFFYF